MSTLEINYENLVPESGNVNLWHVKQNGILNNKEEFTTVNGEKMPAEYKQPANKITISLAESGTFEYEIETHLPLIKAPKNLHVGSTGYPEHSGPVDQQFGRFYDVFGRLWAIIGSQLIFQRYSKPGSTFFTGRINNNGCLMDHSMEKEDKDKFIENAKIYNRTYCGFI